MTNVMFVTTRYDILRLYDGLLNPYNKRKRLPN